MLKLSNRSIEKRVDYDSLYSLRSLRTPSGGKLLAKWLIGFSILFFLLLFLPWQQNIRGNGNVTALDPMNRPQTVETVIAGQVKKWHVREGDLVSKGDTIITISEVKEQYFDPQLMTRLQQQITAKENSLISKDQKAKALERQITAMRNALKLKLEQATATLQAEKIRFQNAENQFQRNKKLYEAGNIPLTKFQEFEYKYQETQAVYLNAQLDLGRVEAEYLDKISKAESELNNTRAEAFDTQAAIVKARNEFTNVEIRNSQYQILAPQDGYIVKAMKAGIGETIKEGDAVCTIMPQSADVAVEMYVKAMDIPLISKGRKVRVEFDGWPALQFSGWPSVSVGTFGGEVRVIDYVNSKPGEFRILIVPDKNDDPWPKQIRVGSGTKGWVMLDSVPIWYELWRQLNGFPPSLYKAPLEEQTNWSNDKKP
ncbi:MAG: HlyD family secretion protein [Cyclobacteriaceae bacterium]|nr:HlyD family secretion protein [Cyclobacteriaceae bacterium]